MSGDSLRRAVLLSMPLVVSLPLACVAQKPQEVSFKTVDGVTIVADYYPPVPQAGLKAPIVILLHMYPADRTSWRDFAKQLSGVGIAALAIDMRGHGKSVEPADMHLAERREQRDPRLYAAMHNDVAAAYQWLAQQPGLDLARFAIVGASVGCSVAIDYARRDRSVDAVVCLSPGTNYMGLDSAAHIRGYGNRPILLMASQEERAACETLAKLCDKATVKIYPMNGHNRMQMHGTNLLTQVPEATNVVLDFIRTNLGLPTEHPIVASIGSDVYHAPDSPIVRRIKPENLRWFSSVEEAQARGLRPALGGPGAPAAP
jgi:dienelactone hydrolase